MLNQISDIQGEKQDASAVRGGSQGSLGVGTVILFWRSCILITNYPHCIASSRKVPCLCGVGVDTVQHLQSNTYNRLVPRHRPAQPADSLKVQV